MAFSTQSISSDSNNAYSNEFGMENLESRQLMSVSLGNAHMAPETGNNAHVTAKLITKVKLPIVFHPLFVEPKVDSSVTTWKNFSTNPLFAAGGPSPNDIAQGQIGDCYFLATLASTAVHDPNLIKSDIVQRVDGTYDVFFHKSTGGTVDEHVDGNLPLDTYGNLEYAKLGTGGCTWVAIMEKAFTYFRNSSIAPAYTTINSGWGREAITDLGGTYTEVLTGVHNATDLFNDVVWSMLFNQATEFGTKGTGSGPLVHGHEYEVVSARVSGGVNQIEVRNPWGYNPNFVANQNGYGATNDGYMWVSASSVYPELNEFVNGSM